MKSLIAVSLIIVAILTLVLVTHKTQQNSLNSITEQNSNIKQNSPTVINNSVAINNSSVILSEGMYLLRNSSSVVYIVYYEPINQLKIFNYTFVIAGPLSTFNGVLELQNASVYQKLQVQKEVTVQIYNDTSWKSITLDISYTSRTLQPYAFLVPSEEVIPF